MLSFLYWLFRDALFFFGVVSGRSSFPRPLSRVEKRAVEMLRQGMAGAERNR
jgi:hypothetical protein